MPTCLGSTEAAPCGADPACDSRYVTSAIKMTARMHGPIHIVGFNQLCSIAIVSCRG